MVFATGTTLTQKRLILIAAAIGSPVSSNSETTLTSSTKFTDDMGIKVKAKEFNGTISHVTQEPNTVPPACGFAVGPPGFPGFGFGSGCGLAGVAIKGK